MAKTKTAIWLRMRRFSHAARRRSSFSRTRTRRSCRTPVICAETNYALIHSISYSKSAGKTNVAKAAATLSNAAIRLHVVFGCAAAAFCPAATMKSEAIRSATTAATKNDLASFNLPLFFSIQIVLRLQMSILTRSMSKTVTTLATSKTATTLATSKTAAKYAKSCSKMRTMISPRSQNTRN